MQHAGCGPGCQDKLNDHHAKNPKPGDYWEEHFVAVCVVLAVDKFNVTYCQKKKEVSASEWTWDLTEYIVDTREKFVFMLQYGSNEKYWADVHPLSHLWVVEEFDKDMADMEPEPATPINLIPNTNMVLVNCTWFSGRDNIGVVLVQDVTFGYHKAYIGVGSTGEEEIDDAHQIAQWGSKVQKQMAESLFGPIKLWKD